MAALFVLNCQRAVSILLLLPASYRSESRVDINEVEKIEVQICPNQKCLQSCNGMYCAI